MSGEHTHEDLEERLDKQDATLESMNEVLDSINERVREMTGIGKELQARMDGMSTPAEEPPAEPPADPNQPPAA